MENTPMHPFAVQTEYRKAPDKPLLKLNLHIPAPGSFTVQANYLVAPGPCPPKQGK
jgi:hypothetical protein